MSENSKFLINDIENIETFKFLTFKNTKKQNSNNYNFFNFILTHIKNDEINSRNILSDTEVKLILFEILENIIFSYYENLKVDLPLVEEFFNYIYFFKDNNLNLKNFFLSDLIPKDFKQDLFKVYSKYEIYKKKFNFYDRFDIYDLYLEKLGKEDLNKQKNNINFLEKILGEPPFFLIQDTLFLKEKKILSYLKIKYIEVFNKENKYQEISDKELSNKKKLKKTNLSSEFLINKDNTDLEIFLINKILEYKKNKKKLFICIQKKEHINFINNFIKKYNLSLSGEISSQNSFYISFLVDIIKIILNPKQSDIEIISLLKYLEIEEKTILYLVRKKDLAEKNLYYILKKTEKLSFNEKENLFLKDIIFKLEELINLKKENISLNQLLILILNKFEIFSFILSQKNFLGKFEILHLLELLKAFEKTSNSSNRYNTQNLEKFYLFVKKIQKDNLTNIKVDNELIFFGNINNYFFDSDIIFPFASQKDFSEKRSKQRFQVKKNLDSDFLSLEEKVYISLNLIKSKTFKIIIISKENCEIFSCFTDFFNFSSYNGIKIKNTKEPSFNKKNIINKINKFLISGQIEKAKQQIDLLSEIFEKKEALFLEKQKTDLSGEDILSNIDINNFFDPKTQVYSVSQLKTYQSCPKKYLFQYIYKIPTIPKQYFDFGTSIHEVLENILPLFSKNLKQEEIFSKAMSLLLKNWISIGYTSSEQEKEYFNKGIEIIRNFILKQSLIIKKQETQSLEFEFNIEIENKKLIGFIDRLDFNSEGFKVLDYKTSNSILKQEEIKKDFQLYIYALAIKKIKNTYPKTIGLWYLNFDKIIEIDFNENDLEKILIEVKIILKNIENLNFSAKPSKFSCTYCDFNKICFDKFQE